MRYDCAVDEHLMPGTIRPGAAQGPAEVLGSCLLGACQVAPRSGRGYDCLVMSCYPWCPAGGGSLF
jgi:hypothetical protein